MSLISFIKNKSLRLSVKITLFLFVLGILGTIIQQLLFTLNERPLLQKPRFITTQAKPGSLFITDVVSLSEINDGTVTLQFSIQPSYRAQKNIQYEWLLPYGVSIIEGHQSGDFSMLDHGYTAVIKLSGLNENINQNLILNVNLENSKIGVTHIYPTRLDLTDEGKVLTQQKRTSEIPINESTHSNKLSINSKTTITKKTRIHE